MPLKDWDIRINYGIKTGCNEAFIINEQTRAKLIAEDPKSAEIIRPILRGRDIKRNGYEFAGLYVILAIFDSHKWLKQKYPAIYNHLSQYEDKLKKRGQCRYLSSGKVHNPSDRDYPGYPGMHHWLELDNNPRQKYMDDFNQQRFIWTAVNSEYRFLAVDQEIYYNNSIFHGLSSKSSGIVSIMNSKIMRYYLILISSEGYQYGGKEMMQNIPIPPKIENIVYSEYDIRKFYHLSDEEFNLIESSL